jgi:orotate phosphoribosyltransferase
VLGTLASAYATTIARTMPEFDVLFGPAYKGIPFAAATALVLANPSASSSSTGATFTSRDVGLAYDRKEAKDHGEGGVLVGAPLAGKRVVILDDVMTSGTAIRNSLNLVRAAGGIVVGIVQCLDREEVGADMKSSTVYDMEALLDEGAGEGTGKGKVQSILKMRQLMKWLESKGMQAELDQMKSYWEEYGVKQ